MSGQNDDLQKLVVLNNNVVMQLVQFVGSLQAVQAGTVDALDYLTDGETEQAAALVSQAKEEMTGDLAEAGEGLIGCLEKLNRHAQYYGEKYG